MEVNWLLLRGLFRESGHWRHFADALQRSFPASQIITPDLAGAGRRYLEPSPLRVREAVLDLREQYISHRASSRPFIGLGISLGGALLLNWSHIFPKDFAAQIVINISDRRFSIHQRFSPSAFRSVASLWFEKDLGKREATIYGLTSSTQLNPKEVCYRAALARKHPISRANLIRQLLMARSLRVPDKCLISTHIVVSEKDSLCQHVCGEVLAERLASPLYRHKEAGHDLPWDDPKWLLNLAKRISSDISQKTNRLGDT